MTAKTHYYAIKTNHKPGGTLPRENMAAEPRSVRVEKAGLASWSDAAAVAEASDPTLCDVQQHLGISFAGRVRRPLETMRRHGWTVIGTVDGWEIYTPCRPNTSNSPLAEWKH